MRTKAVNEVTMDFPSQSRNESFARSAAACSPHALNASALVRASPVDPVFAAAEIYGQRKSQIENVHEQPLSKWKIKYLHNY